MQVVTRAHLEHFGLVRHFDRGLALDDNAAVRRLRNVECVVRDFQFERVECDERNAERNPQHHRVVQTHHLEVALELERAEDLERAKDIDLEGARPQFHRLQLVRDFLVLEVELVAIDRLRGAVGVHLELGGPEETDNAQIEAGADLQRAEHAIATDAQGSADGHRAEWIHRHRRVDLHEELVPTHREPEESIDPEEFQDFQLAFGRDDEIRTWAVVARAVDFRRAGVDRIAIGRLPLATIGTWHQSGPRLIGQILQELVRYQHLHLFFAGVENHAGRNVQNENIADDGSVADRQRDFQIAGDTIFVDDQHAERPQFEQLEIVGADFHLGVDENLQSIAADFEEQRAANREQLRAHDRIFIEIGHVDDEASGSLKAEHLRGQIPNLRSARRQT